MIFVSGTEKGNRLCPGNGKICYEEEWKAKLAMLKYRKSKQYYWHKRCKAYHITNTKKGKDSRKVSDSYTRGMNSPHLS